MAKSVYANLKMNTFFGCDIVNYRDVRNEQPRRGRRPKPLKSVQGVPIVQKDTREPLKRTIFSTFPAQIETDGKSSKSMHSDISFLDIINMAQERQKDSLQNLNNPLSNSYGKSIASKQTFIVKNPNPYASADDPNKTRIVNVSIHDVVSDD